jgi:hypothetical protein
MPLNNSFPLLNDVAPSFADVVLKITPTGGPVLTTEDFAALTDGRTVEVGEQRGASGGRVMRRTTGSISYEASITFYRSGYQTLYRAMAALAPTARGNQKVLSVVPFNVQIQHTPFGTTEIYDRRWRGCRIIGDGMSLAEGTEADQIEVPVSVIEIVDIIDGVEVALL